MRRGSTRILAMTAPTTIPDDRRERAAYVALALTPGIGSKLPDIIVACTTPLGAVLAPSAFLGSAGFSRAAIAAIKGATVEAGELYAAVADLPDDFRDVLVAVDITGLSYKEAAEVLRIREGTVMSRLYRARQQVVRRLEGAGAT